MTGTQKFYLDTVHALLPRLYSKGSLPVYESAFGRIERLTRKRLRQIPATEKAWAETAAGIVWAGEFNSRVPGGAARVFRDWCSRINGAIRKAQAFLDAPEPVETGIDIAWDRILTYVAEVEGKPDGSGVVLLASQTSLSVQTLRKRLGHVHPAMVDRDTAIAALAETPPGKVSSFRRALRVYNKLIRDSARHPGLIGLLPAQELPPLPSLRDERFDWSACDASFVHSIDRAIAVAIRGRRPVPDRFGGHLGVDRLAERRAARKHRKRRVRKPETARKSHRQALSWLARHGVGSRDAVYAMTSLSELLTGDAIEAAARAFAARSRNDPALRAAQSTTSLGTYLSSLTTLARANDFPDEVIWALEDAPYLLGDEYVAARGNRDRMSVEREKFVKLLDRDKEKVLAIVRGPRVLAAETRRRLKNWDMLGLHARSRALHLCMSAAAMALQLTRPLRTFNVNEMTISGDLPELLPPARDGETAWVDIGRDRTKNRRPIEHPLPDWAWEIATLWLEHGRARWIGHNSRATAGNVQFNATDNDYLFPGVAREGAICRGLFNKAWNLGVQDFLGLRGLNPHVMRHVAATIYLAAHPGKYADVASLLGDTERTVEAFYCRGAGREAAELFAAVLVEIDPLLDLDNRLKRTA